MTDIDAELDDLDKRAACALAAYDWPALEAATGRIRDLVAERGRQWAAFHEWAASQLSATGSVDLAGLLALRTELDET